MRRAATTCVPEGVGEDQAPLGVGVGHLDREARSGCDHIRGPDRAAAQHVLAGRHDAGDRKRERKLGDCPHCCHHGRAARHVSLLTDDVRLRLEEVAPRIERDRFPDERQSRCIRRAGRVMSQHEEKRPCGTARADGGERAEPRLGRADRFGCQPRKRRRPLREPCR